MIDIGVMLVLGLMVWRLTRLLLIEEGPFRVFSLIREMTQKLGLQKVLECFHCASIWIASITMILFEFGFSSIIMWLSVSAVASIIQINLEMKNYNHDFEEIQF